MRSHFRKYFPFVFCALLCDHIAKNRSGHVVVHGIETKAKWIQLGSNGKGGLGSEVTQHACGDSIGVGVVFIQQLNQGVDNMRMGFQSFGDGAFQIIGEQIADVIGWGVFTLQSTAVLLPSVEDGDQ